ncbi:hypothetical protein D3C79_1026960 [compost metagenome]
MAHTSFLIGEALTNQRFQIKRWVVFFTQLLKPIKPAASPPQRNRPYACRKSLTAISVRVVIGSCCFIWVNCSITCGTTATSRMPITATATTVRVMG